MIDTALRTYLLTLPAVTNIVGASGVYVDRAQQGATAPYAVVTQFGGNPEQHAGGASTLHRADISIDCWGADPVGAGTLADAIETALAAKQTTMGGVSVRACLAIDKARGSETPDQGDQVGRPGVRLTFEVFYEPA